VAGTALLLHSACAELCLLLRPLLFLVHHWLLLLLLLVLVVVVVGQLLGEGEGTPQGA
jgi:hypothetical protein